MMLNLKLMMSDEWSAAARLDCDVNKLKKKLAERQPFELVEGRPVGNLGFSADICLAGWRVRTKEVLVSIMVKYKRLANLHCAKLTTRTATLNHISSSESERFIIKRNWRRNH